MDYVRRRGKVYSLIVTVPADLVETVGKKQIWRSLKTKSFSAARTEAHKLRATIEQLFLQMRDGMDNKLIRNMIAEYGLESIAFDDNARINGESFYQTSRSHSQEAVRLLTEIADTIQQNIVKGEPGALGYIDDLALIYVSKYRLEKKIDPEYELTVQDMNHITTSFAQVEKLLHKATAERLQGITEVESDFQYRLLNQWRADLWVWCMRQARKASSPASK